jgi:hypothetical protein
MLNDTRTSDVPGTTCVLHVNVCCLLVLCARISWRIAMYLRSILHTTSTTWHMQLSSVVLRNVQRVA